MSIRTLAAVSLLAVLGLNTACGTSYVTRANHEEAVAQLQSYIDALERRNRDLEATKQGLDEVARQVRLGSAESAFYDQLAKQLEDWLRTSGVATGDVNYDPRTGKWTLSNDVLFDSGKYTLSTKGQEIVNKIAEKYRGTNSRFRVVGHTDRDPIVKDSTKKSLPVSRILNLELSVLRAVAVAFSFTKSGIKESRLYVEGQGNNNPVAANDRKSENKKKNRRVEIYVLGEATGK